VNPQELYQAGKLTQAIDEQLQLVKKSPGDPGLRVFLFELLVTAGELDRAARQLQAVPTEDQPAKLFQQLYLMQIEAERKRREVFEGKVQPKSFAPLPEHVKLRLEALTYLLRNDSEAATALQHASEAAPVIAGDLNGNAFQHLRDCDDLFGTVLEVMAHGEYYWVPLEQVDSVLANDPKYPRDLVWLPAKLSIRQGPAGDVFLPTRYPGTYAQADDELRLGRQTDLQQTEGGPVRGIGTRVFFADEEPIRLLDIRQLLLAEPPAPAAAPADQP
jgi:type VI secretion system protein ImpE